MFELDLEKRRRKQKTQNNLAHFPLPSRAAQPARHPSPGPARPHAPQPFSTQARKPDPSPARSPAWLTASGPTSPHPTPRPAPFARASPPFAPVPLTPWPHQSALSSPFTPRCNGRAAIPAGITTGAHPQDPRRPPFNWPASLRPPSFTPPPNTPSRAAVLSGSEQSSPAPPVSPLPLRLLAAGAVPPSLTTPPAS